MEKKRALFAIIIVFSLLLASSAIAENCCLNTVSSAFCRDDLSASDCCGSDLDCIEDKYLEGVSCLQESGQCFTEVQSCCLDDCSSGVTSGYSSPLSCSSPDFYVQNSCSEYTRCTDGCAFCEGETTSINPSPVLFKDAQDSCEDRGKLLSLFNTTTEDCSILRQTTTNFYSVSGTVTNANNGNPASGVAVEIAGISTSTASSGFYSIDQLPLGTFTLRAWSPAFFENMMDVSITSNLQNQDISVTPIPPGNLIVHAEDDTGSNVYEATVNVGSRTGSTDTDGNVTFSNLPVNSSNGLQKTYTVTAELSDGTVTVQDSTTVQISEGITTPVTLVLSGFDTGLGSLNGYVKNSTGGRIADATVTVAGREYITTSQGFYEFVDLPSGTYDVTAIPPAPYVSRTNRVTITADEITEQNFSMQKSAAQNFALLTVQVNDSETNHPIEGAEVRIRQQGAVLPSAVLTTNAQGTVEVSLLNDTDYIITASKSGYDSEPSQIHLIQDITWTMLLHEQFLVGNRLFGTVTDADNSSLPLAGVAVRLDGTQLDAVSGNDGFFSINNVPFGSYSLVASKTGYNRRTIPILMPFNDFEKNITMISSECYSNIQPPAITEVEIEKNQTVINFEIPCDIKGFYVYRCEGQDCTDTKPITDLIKTGNQFTDKTVEPEKYYTYEIHAYFESPFVQEKISDPASVYTGASQCFYQETTQFCYQNTRSTCDNSNAIIPVEASDSSVYCMQDGDSTKYVQRINCSVECNQPFGMFSFIGNFFLSLYGDDSAVACTDVGAFSSLAYCYEDYARTVTSRYYSCSEINSCYGYNSAGACSQDKCGFGGEGDCIWRSYSDDLSLGVCMPEEKQYWNCSKCNELGKFNDLFGACNEQICDLYGGDPSQDEHYCFFSEGTCDAKDQRSCNHYKNYDQCLSDGNNVSVDTGGDNSIIEESEDYLDFGLCRFGSIESPLYQNRCFKDANNDYEPDPNPTDMKVPFTSVVHPTAANSINFPLFVYDDEDLKRTLLSGEDTYFQIASIKGAFLRPTVLAQNGYISSAAITESNKNYTVWLYSKDDADNLEIVKSFDIYIDMVPPPVDFNYTYDETAENLIVSIISTDYENIRCNAQLYDDNSDVIEPDKNIIDELGQSFSRTYNVSDGVYTYKYDCLDWVGNEIDGLHPIVVDTEGMIYDPQPNTTVRSVSKISVRTMADADCKYLEVGTDSEGDFIYDNLQNASDAGIEFDDMTSFGITGEKYHEASESVPEDSIAKLYLVRCRLETGDLTQSNYAAIRFTVDRLAPETNFYESYQVTTPIEYNFTVWRKQANFKLACYDPQSPSVLPYDTYAPREFGCGRLHYCVDYGQCTPELALTNYTNNENQRMQINATEAGITLNQTKTVCYYSADKGNNEEDVECTLVKVDSIGPRIKITNASGICTEEDGELTCRDNTHLLTINGTVDNAAYWSDKGGLLPYFTDFNFSSTIITSDVAEVNFDYFGPEFYDYVQVNYVSASSAQIIYGKKGGTAFSSTIALTRSAPFKLSIRAEGAEARIYINENYLGNFSRISQGGWIRANSPTNETFSDIIVMDDSATSPVSEDAYVVINGMKTEQTITITEGRFNAVVDASQLLSQVVSEGIIEIQIADDAGNIGKDSLMMIIDTTGPFVSPKFDPPIDNTFNSFGENYDSLKYPINYEPEPVDRYYVGSSDGTVYLSGYTDEPGMYLELSVNGTKVVNYTQPSASEYLELDVPLEIAYSVEKGSSVVTVVGNQTQRLKQITPKRYIEFSGHHRTEYGHYGEWYRITHAEFRPGFGTEIHLNAPIDKDVEKDESAMIANMPREPDRFNFSADLNIPSKYGHAWLLISQFDDLGNTGKPSERIEIIYDGVPPVITSFKPEITTGRLRSIPNITINVFENGTGLREDNIEFTVNGQSKSFEITETPTGLHLYNYKLFYDFGNLKETDGVYRIKVRVTDKANNAVNMSWNLTIDTNLPEDPYFVVMNGVNLSIDPEGWTFVSGVPEVKAVYAGDLRTIIDVVNAKTKVKTLNHSVNGTFIEEGTTCVRFPSTDTFNCSINLTELPGDGDYHMELKSVKLFDDGSVYPSPPKLDIFKFSKDTETPKVQNFTITSKYVNSDSAILFSTKVPNEDHPLKVSLVIVDEAGNTYNLYSNLSALPDSLYSGRVSNSTILSIENLLLQHGKTYNIRINVSDYGGNYNDSESDYVIIDDAIPVLDPSKIFVDASPIYQYIIQGQTDEGESVAYIVREDVIEIYGTVPADVIDLSFYRITGRGEEFISSISQCPSDTDLICVNNESGEFHMQTTRSIVYGEAGMVINNLIKIISTDRAGNTHQTTKFIYSDLETPTITVCTAIECTEYTEETPPITNASEMKSICGQDPSCYDILIKGACTEDKVLDPQCYTNYVSTELKDPDLYLLCLSDAAGIYSENCLLDLAIESCNIKVCDYLSDAQLKSDCRALAMQC